MDVTIDSVKAQLERPANEPAERAPAERAPDTTKTEQHELSFPTRRERLRARLCTF